MPSTAAHAYAAGVIRPDAAVVFAEEMGAGAFFFVSAAAVFLTAGFFGFALVLEAFFGLTVVTEAFFGLAVLAEACFVVGFVVFVAIAQG
jgi:hypothetical protein